MLARDSFKKNEIWWMMVNVFFGQPDEPSLTSPATASRGGLTWNPGNSYLGFDIASKVQWLEWSSVKPSWDNYPPSASSETLALSSSNSHKVFEQSRQEYLFQLVFADASQERQVQTRLTLSRYSVFVLEVSQRINVPNGDTLKQVQASASRRLTYYFPPLNLIPLILFRPLRLVTTSEQLRIARIVLLKATHMPYVAAIWIYEGGKRYWNNQLAKKTGAPKRSMLASHISFSHKASKYSAIRNRSAGSLMTRGNESRTHHQARDPDTVAELKKVLDHLGRQEEMIDKLSRQVEKLGARADA
ncbi:MAG: hypothetical protein Q9174_002622 [Haloplaca sp. 1 TL-2023]